MKTLPDSPQLLRRHILSLVIAAQCVAAPNVFAGPTGGEVTAGEGTIEQAGSRTTINQDSDRLAIDWETFNVARNERVRFNQPTETAVALNRILDNNGSRIMGRIDANGRVILMNPNGVFFGRGAMVNVGSLVATGLMIDTDDFMNGDILLKAVGDSEGTVINRGMIRAAAGGNVALIGKQVENDGFISAQLGHVALASGEQAVVTFDEQGLLGVKIDQATLESEVGVSNRGMVQAQGGKIVLSSSVTQDLFSRAVNAGDMSGDVQAVVHEDGSFTLGAGVDAVNSGILDVANASGDAGEVVMAGKNVVHRGIVTADSAAQGSAGDIHLQATDSVQLARYGSLSARSDGEPSGSVTVVADDYAAQGSTRIRTSGDLRLTTYSSASLGTTETHNASISTIGELQQTGSMGVSGNLHLKLAAEADVQLTHTDNDFNTLSADTEYVSYATIVDSNDIALGDLNIYDSTFRISAQGENSRISQQDDSHIRLGDAALYLTADNIDLGEAGSTTTSYQSVLSLRFTESVNTRDSIQAPGEFNFSSFSALGDSTPNRVAINSQEAFDLDIQLLEWEGIHINTLNANNATLSTINSITQDNPISLDGNLFLSLTAGGEVLLNNPANDFNQVQMDLGYTTFVDLHDANDIALGDLYLEDSSVNITAQDTVSQMPNSSIRLYDTGLTLTGGSVVLGSNDSTTWVANSALFLNFVEHVATNQSISSPSGDLFSWFSASSSGIEISSNLPFDMDIINDDAGTMIHHLSATDASFSSARGIDQTGPITLDGTLHLHLAAETEALLTNADNALHRLTANTTHNSTAEVAARDAIVLGDMTISGSNVYASASGEDSNIYQDGGTHINLEEGSLILAADHITLGGNDSGTTAYNGYLELNFVQSVNTNSSLASPGEFNFSWFSAQGSNAPHTINVDSDQAFDLDIQLIDEVGIEIGRLDATNANMSTLGTISQTGPIALSGDLNLSLTAGGGVFLEDPLNDFNTVQMNLGYTTMVRLADANDLVLGDSTIEDSIVSLTALGEDGTVSQASNTEIYGSDSVLDLTAERIELGADGTSSIRLLGIGVLDMDFNQLLSLTGDIEIGGFYSGFTATGSDTGNEVFIGEQAGFNFRNSDFYDHSITLGDGDDFVLIEANLPVPLFTQTGQNLIHVNNPDIEFELADYDPEYDTIVILNP